MRSNSLSILSILMAIVFFVLSGCGSAVTDQGADRGSELGNMENVPTVSEFM
jgi:uncharacterized protein YceK